MHPAVVARMTEEEYLAYDLAHEGKHEYVNGEVVDMSGVSEAHDTLFGNLHFALTSRLRGGPCRVRGPDVRVRLDETGMYAYPDLVVVCGAPQWAPTSPPSLLNPRVVIEILSETTATYDRGAKAAHYRHRASVEAVVLVDSRRRAVESQTRNPDGTWTLAEQTEGGLVIGSLGVTVPLAEVYEGVA